MSIDTAEKHYEQCQITQQSSEIGEEELNTIVRGTVTMSRSFEGECRSLASSVAVDDADDDDNRHAGEGTDGQD